MEEEEEYFYVGPKREREEEEDVQYMLQLRLCNAVERNNINDIENQIKRGANVNFPCGDGCTALQRAALNRNNVLMHILCYSHNADPDVAIVSATYYPPPLHICIEREDIDGVYILWRNGANVNIRDARDGCTALHKTVMRGNLEFTKTLLSMIRVDTDIVDVNGKTALYYAWNGAMPGFVELLLKTGANPVIQEDHPSLMILFQEFSVACEKGNVDMVRHLLETYPKLAIEPFSGMYPLITSVRTKNENMIFAILSARWMGTRVTKFMNPYLGYMFDEVCSMGNVRIVQFMLNSGDVNANGNGTTVPLVTAIENRHDDIAEYLMSIRVDVNADAGTGITPLIAAIKMNNIPIVRELIALKADVNYAPIPHSSVRRINIVARPLQHAEMSRSSDIIRLLKENGAS